MQLFLALSEWIRNNFFMMKILNEVIGLVILGACLGFGQTTTPFGVVMNDETKESGETGGMVGHLYDLKTDKDGEKTNVVMSNGLVNQATFKDALLELIESNFKEEDLSEYFIAESDLAFTNLFFKNIKAKEAPEAFDCSYIDPSGLLIIYEGVIEKAEMGEFRFVGAFDDILHVYLNDKLVLDGSYHNWTEFKYEDEHPHAYLTGIGNKYGKWVRMKPGDRLRIVLAEVPGGHMGGGLQIQEKDRKYRKDDHDHPILAPFCLEKLSRDDKKRLESYGAPVDIRRIPEFRIKK